MLPARLGELLLASGAVSPDQLSRALDEVRETINPLGGVLISMGVIDEQLLKQALDVQTEIRAGKVTKPDDGINRLSSMAKAHG